jgi:two-component system, cell cycle sensor histidine kinase and response regulator CckA
VSAQDGGMQPFPESSRSLEAQTGNEVPSDVRTARGPEQPALDEPLAGAILDALSARVAVLDQDGVILAVNQAWKDFARVHGLDPATVSAGTNYLAVCDAARDYQAGEAKAMAAGIRAVLEGATREFILEYTCPLPEEKKWFQAHVTRFAEPAPVRVVVAHTDITAVRSIVEALRVSEEKFSRIFHLCPDLITINRLEDGVYLDANQGFTNTLGFTREEVVGRSSLPGDLSIWVDKSDRDRLVEHLKAHGEAIGFEMRFRRRDGKVITALESCKMLEIDGEPCLLSVTRDISERKQAEDILRETAQRLALATASGKLGIWDRDLLDGTLIWDDQMFEIYGMDRGAGPLSHATWSERIHPEDLPAVEEATLAAIVGERPYSAEFRVVCPEGMLRYVKGQAIVIRDTAGKAVRMIGINWDCTAQKEAELERQRLQAELQQAEKLESIGSLAGGIAHDMNNVLAAILIMTALLREKFSDGDPVAKGLDTILSAGNRGRDLVQALTDFARKGLGKQRPLDLNELLRKEVELLQHTTLQKVRLALDLDPSLPAVLGDPSALGNAIMNLSINALDAMPQGGTLRFRSRLIPGGRVELAVMDTGAGMTTEVLSKALEPFFTTKPAGKGTGLGLARAYGTLKAHGGTLDLQSKPGVGTKVFLRMPALFSQSDEQPTQAEPAGAEGLHSKKILFVDDEVILRETIPLMLDSMGHRVETAASGLEALQRLQGGSDIDLVLLDHNMPELTGVETLISLRTRRPDLPVILSTGFVDEATEDVLASIPCVWLLKKPYGKRELQRLLAEVFPAEG